VRNSWTTYGVNNYDDDNNNNNKPARVIRDNEKGKCSLIDVAFSGDRNVIKINR
jgi:hypothetical protein